MRLTLTIIAIAALDVAMLGGLAYAMSRVRKLRPHRPATPDYVPSEWTRQAPPRQPVASA